MKKLTIPDAKTVTLGLQDEIRRSHDARYDHRLHAIILVAQGLSATRVAELLGDSPRTVANWVNQFLDEGLAGLMEAERQGKPSRLSEKQLDEIDRVLRKSPLDCGLTSNLWDGKTLSAYIAKTWNITLGVRQCQRIFRQLGFRLRKPRPMIASSDPHLREREKKIETDGEQ